jgi:membrane protein
MTGSIDEVDYRNAMSTSALRRMRDLLSEWIGALFRIGRWPEHVGPWVDRTREVLAFAARRAADVRLAQVAGSLTFTTVLSLVPLLAVALAVFSAFPLFTEYRVALEKLLLRELLPQQISATILRYLNDFAVKAAGLTTFGLLFLVITALLMILTVDRALNDIWRVRQQRSMMARILVYWALLTLGPLAAGASLSASSYVLSVSAGASAKSGGLVRLLLDVAPFALGGVALAALYVIVPNRKVRWRDALVGGFVASALGELLSQGFAVYIRAGTVTGVYGAFSAVPLFLLWIYLSWFALLFGAAIAATLPMLRLTRFADERRAGNRFITAVALLRVLLQARIEGSDDGRLSLAALARAVRSFEDQTERLLIELERMGYVSRLDGAHAGKWLLTCDTGQTTLLAAFAQLAVDPSNSLLAAQPVLRDWLDAGLGGRWLQQPLAAVLGAEAGAPPPRASV